MEKQVLTREQAEALDEIFEKTAFTKDELIDLHAKKVCSGLYRSLQGPYRSLHDLSVSELAKALYIGYEVEPEFKVGDWLKKLQSGKIDKFLRIEGGYVYTETDLGLPSEFRHATPEEIEKEKERRWWAKHGRDMWELKTKDMLVHRETGSVFEVFKATDRYVRLYGVPSISFEGVKKYYKVACFAEDRKDVKDND